MSRYPTLKDRDSGSFHFDMKSDSASVVDWVNGKQERTKARNEEGT
jgi:hypothetical protein